MKKKILNGLFYGSLISLVIAGSALDSESYIPMIICGLNIAYLFLYTLANAPRK